MAFLTGGDNRPTGSFGATVRRDLGPLARRQPPTMRWRLRNAWERWRGTVPLIGAQMVGAIFGAATIQARTRGIVYRPDWTRLAPEQALRLKVLLQARVDLAPAQVAALLAELGGYADVREVIRAYGGALTDYGLLSTRLVTDTGVGFIVDAFQNLVELENMKFHGFGTGTAAEAASDAALGTELTTEYVVNNTRPTATAQTETSANIYRTIGTLSPDSGGTLAITEHGVFSAATGGVLLDRSKFAAVNVVAAADSLQITYDLTIASGG